MTLSSDMLQHSTSSMRLGLDEMVMTELVPTNFEPDTISDLLEAYEALAFFCANAIAGDEYHFLGVLRGRRYRRVTGCRVVQGVRRAAQ